MEVYNNHLSLGPYNFNTSNETKLNGSQVNSQSCILERPEDRDSSSSCCSPITSFFSSIWKSIQGIFKVLSNLFCCGKSKESEDLEAIRELDPANFAAAFNKALDKFKREGGREPNAEERQDMRDLVRTREEGRVVEVVD